MGDKEQKNRTQKRFGLLFIAGIILILMGGSLFYFEPPGEHNHKLQMFVGGALILFGGVFIDKEVTLGYIDKLTGILPISKEKDNES